VPKEPGFTKLTVVFGLPRVYYLKGFW
jgi:hypothetical protein